MRESLDLAEQFPAASEDEWRALVTAVLAKAGRDTDDPVGALGVSTYDGIDLRPLYTDAVAGPRDVALRPEWDVRARLCDTDAARVNSTALAELAAGSTSLWLLAGHGGVAVDDLATALDGVYLDLAPVVLDAGAETLAAAEALLALGDVRGNLGADPIGLFARTGAEPDLAVLAALAQHARPDLGVAVVDATVYHDAGASDADEIGIATAVAVTYLRALTDAGLDEAAAFGAVEFRFAVTADQFGSIAKLRAARRVWSRVAELCGVDVRQRQHAVTSAAMMSRRDPWVNLVRTTIACFAAAVGGADAVSVLPFDVAIGRSDDLARRIARNTNVILHDESGLGRVGDAAGGSWFVESYTSELAEAAWQVFTDIERGGGPLAAFDEIVARVAATRDARSADIAHRRAPLIGVSEYALADEAPVDRAAAPAARAGGPLAPSRWSSGFEDVRDDVEQRGLIVFLAAVGRSTAQVDFARGLFAAGGFEVVVGGVDDFATSGADVACLCGPDDAYDEASVSALRSAGAKRILLAGKAKVPGVDGTIFRGCDALAVLRETAAAHDAGPA